MARHYMDEDPVVPNKKVVVIGGGTMNHVRPHLSLCAPAFGEVARSIASSFAGNPKNKMDTVLTLTQMANPPASQLVKINTNKDLASYVNTIVKDMSVKVVVMSAAVCDFEVDKIMHGNSECISKSRLSSDIPYKLQLKQSEKILARIRKERKDIFLVAFKTTTGASKEDMFLQSQRLMKSVSANLVVANDIETHINFIATPEESIYHETKNRSLLVRNLVDMVLLRTNLTFTRSTVIDGDLVPWTDSRVPDNLRTVVDHCIERGAYKPIQGKTAGHFAVKLSDTEFLTSIRKTNFNDLHKNGLVYVKTDGPDTVIAYGAKPSVGGQSQRIVFTDHPGKDCIVHFHCKMKKDSKVPVVSQLEFECGSHQCGENTSKGLAEFCDGQILAVMLDNHGPNIVFSKDTDPYLVAGFIERNFDLTSKTGPSWEKNNEHA